jgi:hypothetical protein
MLKQDKLVYKIFLRVISKHELHKLMWGSKESRNRHISKEMERSDVRQSSVEIICMITFESIYQEVGSISANSQKDI